MVSETAGVVVPVATEIPQEPVTLVTVPLPPPDPFAADVTLPSAATVMFAFV